MPGENRGCNFPMRGGKHHLFEGGVKVTGFGDKISLDNTLQTRLMLAYETQLPTLRSVLFSS